MMFASSVAVAQHDFITFKNGRVERVDILSWKGNGIKVKTYGKNRIMFYFYVEIESIDGNSIESLKTQVALTTLWAKVGNQITNSLRGFRKKKQAYGKDGSILVKQNKLCENFKRRRR